jgi:hypothetical protein
VRSRNLVPVQVPVDSGLACIEVQPSAKTRGPQVTQNYAVAAAMQCRAYTCQSQKKGLEISHTFTGIGGSNPSLSAINKHNK